jgi:hypothetical protein
LRAAACAPDSLRPLVLQVLGQRRAWARGLLERDDELLALCTLLWDRHSLHSHGGTLAESLYGMKRQADAPPDDRRSSHAAASTSASASTRTGRRAAVAAASAAVMGAASGGQPPLKLSSSQVWRALAVQALVPYLHAKAERLYSGLAQRTVLGLAITRAATLGPQLVRAPLPLPSRRRLPGRGGGGGGLLLAEMQPPTHLPPRLCHCLQLRCCASTV